MTPSTNRRGHHPFKVIVLGSNPTGATNTASGDGGGEGNCSELFTQGRLINGRKRVDAEKIQRGGDMLSSPRWKSSGFLIRRSLVRVQQVAPVSGGLVNASGLAACSVRSHKTLHFIRSWCNGSTRDFDSCSVGSSPADRAKPTDETSMDGRRAGAAGLHHIGGSRMSNAVGPENALYSGRGKQERSAASGRHWQTLQRHGVLSFCGCGVMGAHRPSKPRTRVRSPLSAPMLHGVTGRVASLLSFCETTRRRSWLFASFLPWLG